MEQITIPAFEKSGHISDCDVLFCGRVALITDMITEVSCSSLVREDQGRGKESRDKPGQRDTVNLSEREQGETWKKWENELILDV